MAVETEICQQKGTTVRGILAVIIEPVRPAVS